jgi:signal transduction histidine kinase
MGITRASTEITAQLDLELPLLSVRPGNEVGQPTDSLNRMTSELSRSQEKALPAAECACTGELAAWIAHAVRTPLRAMRSTARLLAEAVR